MTRIRMTHVGGPTMLLEIDGWRLLTDPTFDPPGRRYRFGWGTSSRKLSGPALDESAIGPVDAILLTHDHHADNLDDAGRRLLESTTMILTTTSAARRLGPPARGLLPWATTELVSSLRPGIEVTATPCRHGPPGSHRIVGDVVGFALRWPGQRHGTVWITGDTVLYPGVLEVAERFDVGMMIVHLGAVRFGVTGPVRYTLTARDAVCLAERVRPKMIVPVHYEGWSHFRQGRSAAERAFTEAPIAVRDSVRWLPIGTAIDVDV